MSTTVVNSVLGYVFWLLAARLFPAEFVGLTAAVISASTVIVLLAGLGIGGALIQALPGARNSPVWSQTFWAGMATAIVVGASIVIAAVWLLPVAAEQFSIFRGWGYGAMFAIGTLAMIAGSIFDYVFIAERAADRVLIRSSIVAVAKVTFIVALSALVGVSAYALLGAWAAAALIGLGLGAALARPRMDDLAPPRAHLVVQAILKMRRHIAGQQLIGMGAALLPYVLSVVVAIRLSATDNAYFFTTWAMSGLFLVIAPAVSLSLFAEGAHDRAALRDKARSALALVGAILVPGALAVLAFGGIVLSTFGEAYQQSATGLLHVVLLAAFPDAVTNIYLAVLRVQGRLKVAAALSMGMGVGTVALAWVLLPTFGVIAVGWAFLLMQSAGCLFVLFDLAQSRATQRGLVS